MAATKEQYAYLAGLIDGDGCVAFRKRKDSKTKSGFSYTSQMIVTSKDEWFLLDLQKVFGGYMNKQGRSVFNGKQIWSLRFTSNQTREMLPKLIPHFVLKKQEAELLQKGLAITARHRFKDYSRDGLDEIVDKIKFLKKNREVTI